MCSKYRVVKGFRCYGTGFTRAAGLRYMEEQYKHDCSNTARTALVTLRIVFRYFLMLCSARRPESGSWVTNPNAKHQSGSLKWPFHSNYATGAFHGTTPAPAMPASPLYLYVTPICRWGRFQHHEALRPRPINTADLIITFRCFTVKCGIFLPAIRLQ